MTRVDEDEIRDHRIEYKVIVDAYDPEELAMGWQTAISYYGK
ncbi:MAG: calcium-binding protein [Chlorobiaceae bacterium]